MPCVSTVAVFHTCVGMGSDSFSRCPFVPSSVVVVSASGMCMDNCGILFHRRLAAVTAVDDFYFSRERNIAGMVCVLCYVRVLCVRMCRPNPCVRCHVTTVTFTVDDGK